ncbi:MAG: aldo/keto reductase [Candidatus Neomarinimicrobiota bacterium]|jgi:hypothetical protein|nr:aldo/keto reductase [Candidatus Neomarinimicrobiota bacterium]MDD3966301.1 aldo/keto reductase [Candidatus Neomarinimicrobiota bacterium]MDX9779665.1 aldo/keto reductase [bacterium]
MNYRNFGKTGLRLSALGMGCMRLPLIGGRNENIDEKAAVALVRRAIDGGINYVDTAWNYHGGNGEPLVGKALRNGYRQKTFLATKLPAYLVNERRDMDDFLKRQLQRLETEYIDFYLLHALNRNTWKTVYENGVLEFLEGAKKDGRIRFAGFSFHDDYPVFDRIFRSCDWDFCQIQYNIIDIDYQAGKKGLLQAAANGAGVIIMEPLRGGGLTQNIPENIQAVWNSQPLKRSPADGALSWLWDQPEVGIVLSGMSTAEQLEENLQIAGRSGTGMLTEEEKARLAEIRRLYMERIRINCTGCAYCMPCPHGVDIPGSFQYLNLAAMINNPKEGRRLYNLLVKDKGKAASQCIACGECLEKCPQRLPIPELLQTVIREFEQ